jgi:cellulose synthase/poly-beta-1,6-N-acetylglucosamine synthase-like glycosyltransferase
MPSPPIPSAEHPLKIQEFGRETPPAVTVITAAFNAAPFLEQTLASALSQTFTDFELLVVDDGSTDRTAHIAESFARTDPRIRVVRQRNAGTAAARNTAMARARADLFAILDSDDVWFPSHLAEQVRILRQHPDIGVLAANAINLGGELDGQLLLPSSRPCDLKDLSLEELIRAEDSMSIMAMFRRDVADALGGFDRNLRRSEDYDFWLRAADAGFRIAVNMRPLGLYRRRPDSLSADEPRMLEGISLVLTKLRQQCADRDEIVSTIDRQLTNIAERAMRAHAREALLHHDREQLALHIGALAGATGAMRYRVAKWLTAYAPTTIWWAYRCKQRLAGLGIRPTRRDRATWTSQQVAQRADFQG